MFACGLLDGGNQGTPSPMPPRAGIDEQILEIAVPVPRPSGTMVDVVGDADDFAIGTLTNATGGSVAGVNASGQTVKLVSVAGGITQNAASPVIAAVMAAEKSRPASLS